MSVNTLKSQTVLILGVLFLSGVGWHMANADDLVYTFSGILPAGSTSHAEVSDFETFTAVFTIDPSVADSDPSASEGFYFECVLSGVVTFSGGYSSPLAFSNYDVVVFNNSGIGPIDGVSVRSGGIVFQASNRDLSILASDSLPPSGATFNSDPDPETVPFFQLNYADAGGEIQYDATDAHNVRFAAKNGIAWRNAIGASPIPYYDIVTNWLAGLDSGPPSTTDNALFNLVGSYEVWWDATTGDRTVDDLCVTHGNVTFDNRDGGNYTVNVTDDVLVSIPAELNLGDGTDTVNLDIASFLVVDGDLNAFQGTSISQSGSDIGRDGFGHVRIDGSGTLLETGLSEMYIGANDLGDLIITNGAIATDAASTRIGGGTGGNGFVVVDGTGSQWDVEGNILIGNFSGAVGVLIVSDGATVTAENIEAGFAAGLGSSIAVDDATLSVADDFRIGGADNSTLNLENNGMVNTGDAIIISPTSIVTSTGTGTPDLIATTIINAGLMVLGGDVGADIRADVVNGGSIQTTDSAATFFFENVVHNGTEIETAPGAATRFFGSNSVGGSGDYTGTGVVTFDGNFNPGAGSGLGTTANISFEGNVVLNFGSTLNIDIGSSSPSGFDRLSIDGDVQIVAPGSLSVTAIGGFVPTNGQVFPIVQLDGSRTGTFAGLPEGASVGTYGGTDLLISYVGGDGNDIVLNAVGGSVLLGDVNMDGVVNLLDVQPFVDLLTSGGFQLEADINMDGVVDLLDVGPFVAILTGG